MMAAELLLKEWTMDESNSQETEEQDVVELEPDRLQYAIGTLRDQQNLGVGILAGTAAAGVGAGVWALITVLTEYQIGWMAVGVGVLVGFSLRKFGKGIDKTFGIAGAALALFGCLLGNLLAVCGFVSVQESIPFLQVLGGLTPSVAAELLTVTFSPIDVLFYGIAVYEGYKLSFRQVTKEDLQQILPELRQQNAA
jgi:hypothetical protein